MLSQSYFLKTSNLYLLQCLNTLNKTCSLVERLYGTGIKPSKPSTQALNIQNVFHQVDPPR